MEVRTGVPAVSDESRSGPDVIAGWLFAFEGGFHIGCPVRGPRKACHTDADEANDTGVLTNAGGDSNGGKTAGGLAEFLVAGAGEAGLDGDDDFGNDLAGFEGGGEGVEEEVR